MNLPSFVVDAVTEAVGTPPMGASAVGGGCIHEAARIETTAGSVFAKWSRDAAAGMFEIEASGLALLQATGTICVPTVLHQDERVLVLSWVEPSSARGLAMRDAGHRLAQLHEERGHPPGLDRDGYIGTLRQQNVSSGAMSWLEFFRTYRVEALTPCLPAGLRGRIEGLDFEGLLHEPDGGCALLHGDLWGGNLVCGDDGAGWFVDPAVYCGHPEVDLAMTTLFGGFSDDFYEAYQDVAGRFDADLQDRLQLLNVYPLLVHVSLFGGGYQIQLDAIARRFS